MPLLEQELKNSSYLVVSGGSPANSSRGSNGSVLQLNESLSACQQDSIMGSILQNASPYLYPFIVEYSLTAAAFLYIMWSFGIGKRYSMVYEENCLSSVSCHQVPVDNLSTSSRTSSLQNFPALYSCLGSSKGLCFCLYLYSLVPLQGRPPVVGPRIALPPGCHSLQTLLAHLIKLLGCIHNARLPL